MIYELIVFLHNSMVKVKVVEIFLFWYLIGICLNFNE